MPEKRGEERAGGEQAGGEQAGGDRVAILIVDDDDDDRRAIREALQSPTLEIIDVATGDEALRVLLERDLALLFIDLEMPGMSGLELAERIMQRPRAALRPIVFLSDGPADVETIERCYRAGAIDVQEKGIPPVVLRSKVAIHAELFRARTKLEAQSASAAVAEERERALMLRDLGLSRERRYRNLADAVPDIVWTAGPDGAIDYYNRRWFEFSGLSAGAAATTPWLSLVHPEEQDRCRARWEAALEEGARFEGEYRFLSADGSYRWLLARAIPERGQSGGVVSWLGTFTDIEENKRAERERERLLSQTMEAVRTRDEFLSVASHELKTPVTSLRLQLELLLRKVWADGAEPKKLAAKLESSIRHVDKLGRLVGQLVGVTRIQSGKLELELEDFDLSLLVQQIVDRFAEDAAQAGVDLSFRCPAPVVGRWDHLQIDQVITNLITNAIKFGAGQPVEVAVSTDASTATLVVRDHGPGIEPDDLDRIFERFERTSSARTIGGMGLGLYIVRRIVVAHGGTISVESEPGEGSSFIASLPLRPTPK